MSALDPLRDKRVLAGGTLVLLLVVAAAWPRAVDVELATVARGPLRVTVDEEGETRVRDRFVVTAPVAGRVQRIELEPGDAVKGGQTVVATFLPADPVPLDARSRGEAEAGVASAASSLERAKAALALARSELSRARELARQDVLSAQVLETREAEARVAESSVAAAQHQLELARARVAPPSARGRALEIRAPIDGVVMKRHRESEAVVNAGEPLLDLGNPAKLEVVADLLSTDAVRVKPGASVSIEGWGGDRALPARVRRVEPSGFMKISALGVEEQRVNVVVDFVEPAEAWKSLGDGYRVEVRIVTGEAPDAVKVPTSALFRRGEDWAAFVEEGGRARLRRLQVGLLNGQEAEVRSGLEAGARVIVHPGDTLADGVRIKAREQS